MIKKMLSIHMTDLCNNKCLFCVVDSPKNKIDQVSTDRIFQFLEENKDMGYDGVNLHGGEATTRSDFFDILVKIKECGYNEIVLQTNGRRLSNYEYAKKSIDAGISQFVVSIHGYSPEVHDGITRKVGSLEQAIKGIANVKSLQAKVRTNTVVCKLNQHEIFQIADLLFILNVDHINISALHTAGAAFRYFDVVTPTYADTFDILKKTVEKIQHHGTKITLEGFPLCTIRGMESLLIEWNSQMFKMLFRNTVLENYESYMDGMMRIHGPHCSMCKDQGKCGGFYKEYIQYRGWSEIDQLNSFALENKNAITV